MTTTLLLTFGVLAFVGHTCVWLTAWNRVQSTAMPLWMIAVLSDVTKIGFVVLPILTYRSVFAAVATETSFMLGTVYVCVCTCTALIGIPSAIRRRRSRTITTPVRRSKSSVERIPSCFEESVESAPWLPRLLLQLPGNQSFEIEDTTKEIEIPRLNESLDGISIAHLSDLHFTGFISRSYFDRAIEMVNEMDADLIAVTGDLVDNPEYMSWLPGTLGGLRSRHGVYVVLGNHDCQHNLTTLRTLLSEFGLETIGGRIKHLRIRDQRIILAGNELPWIPPSSDMVECPTRDEMEHLRILLSHTPDQIDWARFYDFDLMLAGHTHGGQVCLPGYGPLVCPSRLPLDFASGTIYESPTVLHVSRGLSGPIPIRWNCRPEITKLVLRCPQPTQTATQSDDQQLIGAHDDTLMLVS